MSDEENITILIGEKKFEPIKYRIKKFVHSRKWYQFKGKIEYYIENDYCIIKGFDTYQDAYEMCALGGISWKDIEDCT